MMYFCPDIIPNEDGDDAVGWGRTRLRLEQTSDPPLLPLPRRWPRQWHLSYNIPLETDENQGSAESRVILALRVFLEWIGGHEEVEEVLNGLSMLPAREMTDARDDGTAANALGEEE